MANEDLENKLSLLSSLPSDKSQMTEEYLASKKSGVEVELLKEKLEGRKQDRMQRGEYANRIFSLVCIYMFAIVVMIILVGFHVLTLDNSVIITLISTTTANIIGVFVIVAKYLFHNQDSQTE